MSVSRVTVSGWILVLAGALVSAPRSSLADEKPPDTLVARLDAYLDACSVFGWSGTALVARDGKVLLRKGYGLADRTAKRANDPQTLFEIASVTKVFTAAAVLALVEDGKLALDDPLARHLPTVPEDKKDITVRHLLTHTSGMSRSVGGGGADVPSAVKSYLGKPRARRPGEQFEYWNGGYALLAALIEQVTGKTFMEFLHARLFERAGMLGTGFTGDERLPLDRQAVGYDGDQVVRRAAEHPYGAYDFRYRGMGGIVTSVEDLWKFTCALEAGKVLRPETVTTMSKPAIGTQALGWGVVESARKTPRLVHGGDVRGFHCAYEVLPAERAVIIVLSNVEGVPAWKLQWNLQSLLFAETPRYPSPPVVTSLPDDQLRALEGTYHGSGEGTLVVEPSDRGLRIGAVGQEAVSALAGADGEGLIEKALARARDLLDAIRNGKPKVIEDALPEGAFYAKAWSVGLVRTKWPEQLAEWGEVKEVRPIGAVRVEGGAVRAVLGIVHEKAERRIEMVFTGQGRLSTLTFDGPRYALERTAAPTGTTTFATFDWTDDRPAPTLTFEIDAEGHRVLRLLPHAAPETRFVRK